MVRNDGEALQAQGATPPPDFDEWDLRRHLGATHSELEQARGAVGQHPEKLRYFLSDRAERP